MVFVESMEGEDMTPHLWDDLQERDDGPLGCEYAKTSNLTPFRAKFSPTFHSRMGLAVISLTFLSSGLFNQGPDPSHGILRII